jgi:hypothetical protein
MKINTTSRHPQRQFETELSPGGVGPKNISRPRLIAKWVVGDDGELTCQWDKVWWMP